MTFFCVIIGVGLSGRWLLVQSVLLNIYFEDGLSAETSRTWQDEFEKQEISLIETIISKVRFFDKSFVKNWQSELKKSSDRSFVSKITFNIVISILSYLFLSFEINLSTGVCLGLRKVGMDVHEDDKDSGEEVFISKLGTKQL